MSKRLPEAYCVAEPCDALGMPLKKGDIIVRYADQGGRVAISRTLGTDNGDLQDLLKKGNLVRFSAPPRHTRTASTRTESRVSRRAG
jgi:hypothetical protein